MFLCLDFEQNSAQNPKYKNFCSEFVQKNNTYAYLHYANRLSINIEVTSKDFVDKFLDLYNKTICFTNL